MFFRFVFLFGFIFINFAWANKYWNTEKGASTMKMLSLPTAPRQAALSGAGIANPVNAGETMRNPLAGAAEESSVLSFSRTDFSDNIGANKTYLLAHSVFGTWHLTAGFESLNYEEIQGYTEDGLTEDGLSYAPGTLAAQLGVAKKISSLTAAITARYANQKIEDYYEHGFLLDGGVKYDFKKYLSFGAVFNNLGIISAKMDEKEIAPLSFQAGATATLALPFNFLGALSTDLYRRTDSEIEFRTGFELMYNSFFALRLGYPISKKDTDALTAGFEIKFPKYFGVEYAYQNRKILKANHVFGINLYF